MKFVLIIVCIFLTPNLIFGQKNKNCGLVIEKDVISGIKTRSTNYERVGIAGKNGELKFKITETFAKDTIIKLHIKIHRLTERCFGKDSKLMIMFGEEMVTLKLSGDNSCGIDLFESAELTSNVIKYLGKKKISLIRVQYTSGFDDFSVKKVQNEIWTQIIQNKSDYFIRTLPCFE